ncbi:MAG: DNA polymerase II large subunit [Candidatus Micrarchaeales archaeon]
MDINSYFNMLSEKFDSAFSVASKARAKGLDPKSEVEIKPAPDLASRVEGILDIRGLAEIIRKNYGKDKTETAFKVVKEVCESKAFDSYDTLKRIELATRIGLAIITDGVVVAPTEGIQGVVRYKNQDNTDYIALIYAGPIRGAGGTAAALSVAFADYARRFFNIGAYKPTQDEVERYVEEVEIYHMRQHLQYKPSEDDLRNIVSNCPVCIDGVATEDVEVTVHRDIRRIEQNGKEVMLTNRVRGGVALVLCEGIAQKAKKLIKEVKIANLNWDWLNNIIKVNKVEKSGEEEKVSVFLEELVAGRPVIAYPGLIGGLRLRYGRSRLTGIAAKGFNPATMILLDNFIAIGTQLKVELPGKGCVASPVDSIEGPFVVLKNGEALRVNSAEKALELKNNVEKIVSLGDILITFGDFKKSNTPIQPTSYVEEFWEAQLKNAGYGKEVKDPSFKEAYVISLEYNIPIHPKYLFEFQSISIGELEEIAKAIIRSSKIEYEGEENLFSIKRLLISENKIKEALELLQVPHRIEDSKIVIEGDYAQSLIASLGFAKSKEGLLEISEVAMDKYAGKENALDAVNSVAPFKIPRRSTYIGARVGRPEKAKERLMKPAPHVLFPISEYGGKERNITKAYIIDEKKFSNKGIEVEIANYKCEKCKRYLPGPFCYDCNARARIERICPKCGYRTFSAKCERCGAETVGYATRNIDIRSLVSDAMKRLKLSRMPEVVKGVKGLTNKDKIPEPIEKGILRSFHNVYTFKDGTARFDATDVPITHFYPSEIGVSVDKLRELGYEKDIYGNELKSADQLVELKHQDVIINVKGAEYLLRVANFVDDLLVHFYRMEPYYNARSIWDLVGHLVITLSPHTSCGVMGRIIGFTEANVGFAHPYMISARRRNCDGDEDTTMLLLDALINFSKEYLPTTIGGTMDASLILTIHVVPEEVDDEVHAMETTKAYPLEFYLNSYNYPQPSEVNIETVKDRLDSEARFYNINFTHLDSSNSIASAPKRSSYTTLKTMQDKVDAEFRLMDKLRSVDQRDAAKRLIISHFIPDLIGNLHMFSKQEFRCSVCNAKYRRVPLGGKCPRDGGKLLLTVSKGGIEKYLDMALNLAERYDLEPYIKQRLALIRDEIYNLFDETNIPKKQFSLSNFI